MTDANELHRNPGKADKDLSRAAETLITGDADDAPLSEETVAELLETLPTDT